MRLGEGCELYYRAFRSAADGQESSALNLLMTPGDSPERKRVWAQTDETFNRLTYPCEAASWHQKLWRKCWALPLCLQAEAYLISTRIRILLTLHEGEIGFNPKVLSRRNREAELYWESLKGTFRVLWNDQEGSFQREKALFQLQIEELYHDHRLPVESTAGVSGGCYFVHDEAAIRESLSRLSWNQFRSLSPFWQSRLGLGEVGEWAMVNRFNPEILKQKSFTTLASHFPQFGELPAIQREWLLKQSNCTSVAKAWPDLVARLPLDRFLNQFTFAKWEQFLQRGGYSGQNLPYGLEWDTLLLSTEHLLLMGSTGQLLRTKEEISDFFNNHLTLKQMLSINPNLPLAKEYGLDKLLPLSLMNGTDGDDAKGLFYEKIKEKISLQRLMELPQDTRGWLQRQLTPPDCPIPWEKLEAAREADPNNRFFSFTWDQLEKFIRRNSDQEIDWTSLLANEKRCLLFFNAIPYILWTNETDNGTIAGISLDEGWFKEILNDVDLSAFRKTPSGQELLVEVGITPSIHQKLSAGGRQLLLSETSGLRPFVFSWLLSKMGLDQLSACIADEQKHRDWLTKLEGLPKESFWHQLSLHQWNQLLKQIARQAPGDEVDCFEMLLARESQLIANSSSACFVSSNSWEAWIKSLSLETIAELKSGSPGLKNDPSRQWLLELMALVPKDARNSQQVETGFCSLSLATLSTLPLPAVDWLLDKLAIDKTHQTLSIQRDDFLHRIAIQSTSHLLWLPSLSEWHQALSALLKQGSYEENSWQQLLPDDPSFLPRQSLLRYCSPPISYQEFTEGQLTDAQLEAFMADNEFIRNRFPPITTREGLTEKYEANASWHKQLQGATACIRQLNAYAQRHRNEPEKLVASIKLINSLTEELVVRDKEMQKLWREVTTEFERRKKPLGHRGLIPSLLPNYRFPSIDHYPAVAFRNGSSGLELFFVPNANEANQIASYWLKGLETLSPVATLNGLLARQKEPYFPLTGINEPLHCYLLSDETNSMESELEELLIQREESYVHWRLVSEEGSIEQIYQLKNETFSSVTPSLGVGIANTGNSCYANALFQALIRVPSFWELVQQRKDFERSLAGTNLEKALLNARNERDGTSSPEQKEAIILRLHQGLSNTSPLLEELHNPPLTKAFQEADKEALVKLLNGLGDPGQPTVAEALLKAREDFDRASSLDERGAVISALRDTLSKTRPFKRWPGAKLTTSVQQAADEVLVHMLDGLAVPGQQLSCIFEHTFTANYPKDGVPKDGVPSDELQGDGAKAQSETVNLPSSQVLTQPCNTEDGVPKDGVPSDELQGDGAKPQSKTVNLPSSQVLTQLSNTKDYRQELLLIRHNCGRNNHIPTLTDLLTYSWNQEKEEEREGPFDFTLPGTNETWKAAKFKSTARLASIPKMLLIRIERVENAIRAGSPVPAGSRPTHLDVDPGEPVNIGEIYGEGSKYYKMSAFLIHSGGLESGHYICCAQVANGCWMEFNDRQARLLTTKELRNEAGKALVYLLEEVQPTDNPKASTEEEAAKLFTIEGTPD